MQPFSSPFWARHIKWELEDLSFAIFILLIYNVCHWLDEETTEPVSKFIDDVIALLDERLKSI